MRYRLLLLMIVCGMFGTGCASPAVRISGSVTYARDGTSVSFNFSQ